MELSGAKNIKVLIVHHYYYYFFKGTVVDNHYGKFIHDNTYTDAYIHSDNHIYTSHSHHNFYSPLHVQIHAHLNIQLVYNSLVHQLYRINYSPGSLLDEIGLYLGKHVAEWIGRWTQDQKVWGLSFTVGPVWK